MINSKIKTDLTKLTSEKYSITIHINAEYAQTEAANRLNNESPASFHHDAINDVLNDLIRTTFEEALLQNRLTPASAPVVESISSDTEKEYTFKLTFDILPTIDLTKLSLINIKTPIVKVTSNDVEATVTAIINQHPGREEALASLGLKETDLSTFKNEVQLNLQREAESYENEIKKHIVLNCVCDAFNTPIPECMIKPELDKLISTQTESGNAHLSQPELRFKSARKVLRGIIINAVVQETHLALQPQMVRARIEKLATAYEEPEEVIQWYYSNRLELAEVEAKVIEELVVDWLFNACNHSSYEISFTEAATALSNLQNEQ